MAATTDIIFNNLRQMLMQHIPPLKARVDEPGQVEVSGTKPGMQGKKKVDGFYFASVVMKPKDVRLYFFPVYTHVADFDLPEHLRSCLKGKSCFHIKTWSEELEVAIRELIARGIELYQKDQVI